MKQIPEENKSVYLRSDVVNWYGNDSLDLQYAEKTILSEFSEKFCEWDVIDMGVGAGRTSSHLIGKCKKYLGIDYSEQMINKCRIRFHQYAPDNFKCADARNLNFIESSTIDFFLFSFNGIDTVNLEDRKTILREIFRVLKPGAHFAFSSHNLNSDLRKKHAMRISIHPLNFWRSVRRHIQFKWHNPDYDKEKQLPQTMLRDGSESFLLKLAYQHPAAQCKELDEAGFEHHRIFSNHLNKEVSLDSAMSLSEPWIYYLTQKRK